MTDIAYTSRREDGAEPHEGGYWDHDVRGHLTEGNLRQALNLLMARYGELVYHYCCKILGDPILAQDVRQQVFLEAYRDLHQFSGRSSLRSWLLAIARHRAMDASKVRRRMAARIADGAFPELTDAPDFRPSPAESIDNLRLWQALSDTLAELGSEIQTIVLLRFQHGLTYEEISTLCGEKPGTIHARIARALPLLRKGIEARLSNLDRPLTTRLSASQGGEPGVSSKRRAA